MAHRTATDIPLQITSSTTSSERRISPSWTISQLKARLEPITGIPATSQRLVCRSNRVTSANSADHVIEAVDESNSYLFAWELPAYAEILVQDTRPTALQQAANLTDPTLSDVPKYEMPRETYESLSSTVLSYKKANKLGRFAPGALEASQVDQRSQQEQEADVTMVREKRITLGARCRLLPAIDARRGKVAFVGCVELDDIPPPTNKIGMIWVGVALDEPTGKNDGSIRNEGKRYFECAKKCGVFVRPERIEIGDFVELGLEDEALDSDMEEI